ARHWLYQRRPEGAIPDAVKDSRKNTIGLLESIRDGAVTLGMPTGELAPEPGEIKVRSRRQQFSDDLWKGY
ncbi:TPA: phage protein Gp36 family protein, partial [Pseudomonas aeruginosa]